MLKRAIIPAPFLYALCLYVLCVASPASADAYRWSDASGNVFYGSNPPASARNVTRLQTGSVSRYSSERVISGHGRKGVKAAASTQSRARIREADIPVIDAPISEPEVSGNTPEVKLEQGRLSVTHGSSQEITACKVNVRNSGNQTARKVVVSFEWEDGTIVPGSGPDSIAAKGEAVYFISPEHLPIIVKREISGVSYKQAPKPKVLIQSSAADAVSTAQE